MFHSIAPALVTGLLAPVQEAQAPSVLADYVTPVAYVEIGDLDRLEADLVRSDLGQLVERLLPLLEQGLDHVDAGDELEGLDELGEWLESDRDDACDWRELASKAVALLADDAGVDASMARQVIEGLGGGASIAFFEPDGDEPSWAASLSLRPGAAERMRAMLPMFVAHTGGQVVMEPLAEGAWTLSMQDGLAVHVTVREDLFVATSDGDRAARIAAATAKLTDAGDGEFRRARRASRERGERVWLWASPEHIAADMGDVVDLERLGGASFGLATDQGRFATRLRLEREGRAGPLGLLTGKRGAWRLTDAVTTDAMLVVGMGTSAPGFAAEVGQRFGIQEVASMTEILAQAPVLGDVLRPGALGGETLFFVRPGAAGVPRMYVVQELSPEAQEAFAGLDENTDIRENGFVLRGRLRAGHPCWQLSLRRGMKPRSVAMYREGARLVVSDSLLSLQKYLERTTLESPEERSVLAREVLARADVLGPSSGFGEDDLAAFVHVRSEPLAEWVWPYLTLGLSIAGFDDFDDFPDAVEIADGIGDTTLLLFENEHAIEIRGRGLLGGLAVLF